MRALLDVNVLIALLDQAHIAHARATGWLEQHIGLGWLSCPLTQNGCIRVMSQPAYPGALTAAAVAQRLMEATQHASHQFLPDDVSLLEPGRIDWQRVLGHRQVTDHYLLVLAAAHQARLVTFDGRIHSTAVPSASPANLVLL